METDKTIRPDASDEESTSDKLEWNFIRAKSSITASTEFYQR